MNWVKNMSADHSSKGKYRREIKDRKSAVSASSLISSTIEYAKFLTYILRDYKKGKPIVKIMTTPITRVKDNEGWGGILRAGLGHRRNIRREKYLALR